MRFGRTVCVAAWALCLVAGCGEDDSARTGPSPDKGNPAAKPKPEPVAVPPASTKLPQFVDVAPATGLDVENHTGKKSQKDWIVTGMGGGVIVFDYDGDGDVDLLVVDGTMLTAAGDIELNPAHRTRLFRNDGDMRFTETTDEAGIDVQGMGFGGAACDYDGDGDADLYICLWGENRLLRNNADGTFTDVTEAAGLVGDPADMSTSCAWGDVDGDGIHDLYVANYVDQYKQIRDFKATDTDGRACKWRNFDVYCGPPGLPPQIDRLYLGNGDGTFREVTDTHLLREGGDPQIASYGFQPLMTDVDGDGDLDIFVANDTQPNFLWVNDGKGKFLDFGYESGVAFNTDALAQAGMGVDAADVNRDGRLDLCCSHFSHDYNTLYINKTRKADLPSFSDRSTQSNWGKLTYTRLSWGTRLWDFDLDGELDSFVACGHVYGEIENFAATGTTYEQQNLLLRGLGGPDYQFEDVTDRAGPAFQIRRVWRGAGFGDFDDDGDMDVFVTALNGKAALFRNDGGNANAYLRFRLVGKGMQRDPAGVWVTVHTADGRALLEELHHGASFCSDNDPRLSFGLGGHKSVPKVEVRWPDGSVQTFTDVATRKMYVVTQGQAELVEDE